MPAEPNESSVPESADEIEAKLSLVPADFPRPAIDGAVSGLAPKLLLVTYRGKYYPPGATPPEVLNRWERCENLAEQLAQKSLESKVGKRSHMTEEAILDQYLPRLIATRWVSEPEGRWVIRRVAALLSWPVPAAARE